MKWSRVRTLAQTFELVDEGVVVRWSDLKNVSHHLPQDQHPLLVQHLVKNICATTHDRLRCEVSVESLLLWLACSKKDLDLKAAVDQFFADKNAAEGVMKGIEIALTGEITDTAHQEDAYATAVMLACSLAKRVEIQEREGEESFEGATKTIPLINTYLMSVSNLNDYVIRLSLLHYFGYLADGGKNRAEFERLLNRFGYTVLDFLFSLLYKKKNEGLALQFLLENFRYFLLASSSSQKIIHEILKYYLLKRPERSALFLKTLGDSLNTSDTSPQVKRAYLQHLGALLHVVGKVNHKPLAMDLLSCIYRFHDPYLGELSEQIQSEGALDSEEKEFARKLRDGTIREVDPMNLLRSHKRGRHPSFQTSKHLEVFEQVALLGSVGTLGKVS